MDIAVLSASLNKTQVFIGEHFSLFVTVLNNGSKAESFELRVLLNETAVSAVFIEKLYPNEIRNLTLPVETSDLSEGKYLVKVYIPPLPEEKNIRNNTFTLGSIALIPYFRWGLFIILLFIIVLLCLTLATLLALKKKRREKGRKAIIALVKLQ